MYDVVFEAPKFDAAGKLLKPLHARAPTTACSAEFTPSFLARPSGKSREVYGPPGEIADPPPDHNNPVRFRNI